MEKAIRRHVNSDSLESHTQYLALISSDSWAYGLRSGLMWSIPWKSAKWKVLNRSDYVKRYKSLRFKKKYITVR